MTIAARYDPTVSVHLQALLNLLEGYKEQFYDDGRHVPTIGIGHAVIAQRGNIWTRDLALWNQLGLPPLTDEQLGYIDGAIDALNHDLPAAAKLYVAALHGVSPAISPEQVNQLLQADIPAKLDLIKSRFRSEIKDRVRAAALFQSLQNSSEYTVRRGKLLKNQPWIVGNTIELRQCAQSPDQGLPRDLRLLHRRSLVWPKGPIHRPVV